MQGIFSLFSFPYRHKKEKKKDKDKERDRDRRSDRDYGREDREEHSNSKKKKSKDKDRERKSDGDKGDVKVGIIFDSSHSRSLRFNYFFFSCYRQRYAVALLVTNMFFFPRSPGIMMKKNKAMTARRNEEPGRVLTTLLCLPSL